MITEGIDGACAGTQTTLVQCVEVLAPTNIVLRLFFLQYVFVQMKLKLHQKFMFIIIYLT